MRRSRTLIHTPSVILCAAKNPFVCQSRFATISCVAQNLLEHSIKCTSTDLDTRHGQRTSNCFVVEKLNGIILFLQRQRIE